MGLLVVVMGFGEVEREALGEVRGIVGLSWRREVRVAWVGKWNVLDR